MNSNSQLFHGKNKKFALFFVTEGMSRKEIKVYLYAKIMDENYGLDFLIREVLKDFRSNL